MRLATLDDTLALGAKLGEMLRQGDVVALVGPLGAGKTALAKGIVSGLKFPGDVPSPSFPIVIGYDPPDVRIPVLHVDLYRIEGEAALDELGLDDARQDSALIMEWPERLGSRAWPDMLVLTLTVEASGARILTAQVPPAWEARWPPR